MPYRARLKTGEPRKRPKPNYAVTNAHEYNESLKRRGQLCLYCPDGDLKALFINDAPYQQGVSGQSQTYLELIFTFYRLFGWGMRQITGHMQEFWALRGLDIAVPSFGLLSERFRTLKVQVKQRCQRVAECLSRGEAISLIVDSSGMKFGRASGWHRQKYGRDARQTPWRKMHLSIDPQMNVHQIAITEDHVSDEAARDAVLAVDANVDCMIADGADYSIAQTGAWSACGVLPVIPPPANAVVHDQPATRWHDHLVRDIKDKGIHAFRNKYGYGRRALVESQISRIKRCIGARLLTRRLESQQREGVIIGNLLNLWNSFGRPVCVKMHSCVHNQPGSYPAEQSRCVTPLSLAKADSKLPSELLIKLTKR